MSILFANNAVSTLAGAISNVAISATLAAGSGVKFPNPTGGDYFLLTFTDAATGLLNEIVKVTARFGDVLTIVRAQEGTTALGWAAGDNAGELITAGSLSAFAQQANSRTRLAGPATIYVATTGNDSTGDGTSGNPYATVSHAYAVLSASYDLNGFVATIQVADGTYAGVQTLSGALVGAVGPQSCIVNGNVVTPSNVMMALSGVQRAAFQPQNLKIVNAAGDGLAASFGANISTGIGLVFGICSQAHIDAFRTGTITIGQNYTINGGAAQHFVSAISGTIVVGSVTVTLTGTPAFSTAFIQSAQASCTTAFTVTFTGAATGVRYLATENGVISTNGGGANYFPGNSAGSTATGGQYS